MEALSAFSESSSSTLIQMLQQKNEQQQQQVDQESKILNILKLQLEKYIIKKKIDVSSINNLNWHELNDTKVTVQLLKAAKNIFN